MRLLAARFRPDRGLDAGGTLTALTRQGDLTEALLPSGSALGGLFSFSAAL